MKKSKKISRIIIYITLGLVVLCSICVYLYVNSILDKITYIDEKSSDDIIASDIENSTDEYDPNYEEIPDDEILNLEDSLRENLQSNSKEIVYDKNVFNILLIGSDYSVNDKNTRSDSMILLSINKQTKKVIFTSLMRDIYLSIPGYANNRINVAHAIGGPKLLLETIKDNFGISIDKYIRVNFDGFTIIIDTIGGITLALTDDELNALKIKKEGGVTVNEGYSLKLSGEQALKYSRLRKIGNSDFDRTTRQKKVLLQIIEETKNSNLLELNDILYQLLPNIATNLEKSEIYTLLLSYASLRNYDILQDRIPINDSYKGVRINNMSVLAIDFNKNINHLKQNIYGID